MEFQFFSSLHKLVRVSGPLNLAAAGTRQFDDDLVDRLNHRYTTWLISLFMAVGLSWQYVGSPITCWLPAEFSSSQVDYAEQVCWVMSTYYVRASQRLPTPTQRYSSYAAAAASSSSASSDTLDAVAGGGAGGGGGGGDAGYVASHSLYYYQWVPFLLALQAVFFNVPAIFWRIVNWQSRINIAGILKNAAIASLEQDAAARATKFRYACRHIEDSLLIARRRYRNRQMHVQMDNTTKRPPTTSTAAVVVSRRSVDEDTPSLSDTTTSHHHLHHTHHHHTHHHPHAHSNNHAASKSGFHAGRRVFRAVRQRLQLYTSSGPNKPSTIASLIRTDVPEHDDADILRCLEEAATTSSRAAAAATTAAAAAATARTLPRKNASSDWPRPVHQGLGCCGMNSGSYITGVYLLTKVLYIINATAQLIIMNNCIRGESDAATPANGVAADLQNDLRVDELQSSAPAKTDSVWKIAKFPLLEMLSDLFRGGELQGENGLPSTSWQRTGNFPRISFCDIQIRALGQHDRIYTVQCVLGINMFNEKIYIALCIWMFVLIAVTCWSFLSWTYRIQIKMKHEIRKLPSAKLHSENVLAHFAQHHLCNDGLLIISLIDANFGRPTARLMLHHLWHRYMRRYHRIKRIR